MDDADSDAAPFSYTDIDMPRHCCAISVAAAMPFCFAISGVRAGGDCA